MQSIKIVLILFMSLGFLQAQFSKSLEISSYYDDNLFRSVQAEQDVLTDFMLGLSYQPEKSNIKFNYSGDFFLYQNNDLRDFSVHEIGLSYSLPYSKNSNDMLYFGLDYTLRVNGDDYSYYDYDQLYAFASLHLDLDFMFLTTGYNYRHRSYSNLPELTNDRHYIFTRLNKSFESKTTIILEADLGQKSFSGQEIYSTTTMDDGSGWRGGRNSSSKMTAVNSEDQQVRLNQAVLLARVSQSLHEKVGLYVQYRRQFSFTNETSYINADGYYQDEELFDDPFSYESEGYASQLTWVLPWTMKMQLAGALVSKDYISERAYISAQDSTGSGAVRNDDRSTLNFNITKTWFIKKPWIESLHFNLHYNYIRSESNSYWYDYRNNIFGAGIQWNF